MTHNSPHCPDSSEFQPDFRDAHTLCDAMFWAYLHGELEPAEALFTATHFHLSPEARSRLKSLNSCAAVSLESLEPVAMRCSAQEFLKKCCAEKAAAKEECAGKQAARPIPKPLQSYLGMCFDDVRWSDVASGIAEKPIKICGSSSITKIMKVAKETVIPEHGHNGNEMTLVIYGEFDDDGTVYRPGEVSFHLADSHKTHAPKALTDCICLVVTNRPPRFARFFGGVLKPFLRRHGA